MRKPYAIQFTNDEATAIAWHGHRYEATNILDRKLHQTDDETAWVCEFEEHEAWALREAWENDGYTLACGSEELISKVDAFIASIV